MCHQATSPHSESNGSEHLKLDAKAIGHFQSNLYLIFVFLREVLTGRRLVPGRLTTALVLAGALAAHDVGEESSVLARRSRHSLVVWKGLRYRVNLRGEGWHCEAMTKSWPQ